MAKNEGTNNYLLQNESADFNFKGVDYHVDFVGADIFPQGFSAVADRLREFKGINMLCDIGNGTMNVMYINECRPSAKKCFTEKYGTNQCMLAVRENLMKQFGVSVDETVLDRVIRHGTADISERYLTAIRETAKDVDSAELSEKRIALQGEKIQSATSKIKAAYGEKFDPLILFDSKRDVSELLGEKTEVQSVREHLQKKQKQTAERKKISKKNEQER